MTIYTAENVAWLVHMTPWYSNPEAGAIAIALTVPESGRNTRAHNAIPPDNSYGLWQVNMLGDLGPERRAKYGLKSNDDLFNPLVNVRVAYGIWLDAGKSFKPWSAYLHGTYRPFMNGARLAFRNPKRPADISGKGNWLRDLAGDVAAGAIDTAANIPNPLDPVTDAVSFVTSSHNWLRLAMFVGGGALLLIALWALLLQSGAGKTVASVMPSGRAAKLAKGLAQ